MLSCSDMESVQIVQIYFVLSFVVYVNFLVVQTFKLNIIQSFTKLWSLQPFEPLAASTHPARIMLSTGPHKVVFL